ncbi:hypothetical protein SAMN05428988_4070 [Chitinophaga sp. YR573]|nr:hypothetical protein SAMN05428988_4070 [Chitinophaga sp. YR573]
MGIVFLVSVLKIFVISVNMKRITLILLCSMFMGTGYSQVIKFDNGVAVNSLIGDDFDLFFNKVTSYSGLVGLEYFERKWFYLSSEVGYLKLGGKENGTIDGVPTRDEQTWNYGQINTSFRARVVSRKTEFYAGTGPYANVLLGSGAFDKALYDGYSAERINWGFKAELGITQNINRIRVGVNCTYLLPVSATVKSQYTNMYSRSLAFYLSLGYRFK